MKVSPEISPATAYSAIGEFFEIFMNIMPLRVSAAEYTQLNFHLEINKHKLLQERKQHEKNNL